MAAAVKTESPHIVRLEGVCGGEPVIDGLRVTVRHVVTLHQRGDAILDIMGRLAVDLRGRGYDVVRTEEVGKDTAPDEEQLAFAAAEKRAVLTWSNLSSSAGLIS
jgi:hypothetical protein